MPLSDKEKIFREIQREVLRKAHFDANESYFLEREMTQLRAKILEMRFPDTISRVLMPIANDISPSAETYSYKVIKPTGSAKVGSNNAKDAPRVDADAREVLGKVKPVLAAYGWDINELKEAARLGVPISDIKAQIARKAVDRGIDELLAFGDLSGSAGQSGMQLTGMLNNADVVAQSILSGLYWFAGSPPTPTQVLNDLSALAAAPTTASDSLFNTTDVLLPTRHFMYAKQTPFSTVSGDSILKVFLENNPGVTVRPWYRLDTAGSGGVPRAVAYQKDPTVLEGVVPLDFEQLPPEARGFEILVNTHGRCGGVKIYQPLGLKYCDFATS